MGETKEKEQKKKGVFGSAKRALSFSKSKKGSNLEQPVAPDLSQYADLMGDDETPPQGAKQSKQATSRRRLSSKPIKHHQTDSEEDSELEVPDYDIQADASRLSRPSLGRASARVIAPATTKRADEGLPRAEEEPRSKSFSARASAAQSSGTRVPLQPSHSRQASAAQKDDSGSDISLDDPPSARTKAPSSGDSQPKLATSENPPSQVSLEEGSKKKNHSALGHIWKVVRNEVWTPTQKTAADIQAFSVSAAKQAGAVMTTVAERVEEDMTNLHAQILGGKRNLPDHGPASARKMKGSGVSPSLGISVRTDSLGASTADLGPSDRSMTVLGSQQAILQPAASGLDGQEPSKLSSSAHRKPLKDYLKSSAAVTPQPTTPKSQVETSTGSSYMLAKYEEEEGGSPSKFAEAMSKTAAVLSQSTGAMIGGSKSSAIYLKRVLMCGVAGRNKSKKVAA